MEISQSQIAKYTLKTKATERGELLKEFLEVLNVNRVGMFKPLTIARTGMMVAHIPVDGLYYLLSICKDSGNRAPNYNAGFSKRFFFEIRAQKDK